MESNNLPPFYVGEEVEYVTGYNMPKGTKVTVIKTFQAPCGHWTILHDGPIVYTNTSNHSMCADCFAAYRALVQIGTTMPWQASSFRRLQRPKPMTFIKLAEIQETEKEEVLTLN